MSRYLTLPIHELTGWIGPRWKQVSGCGLGIFDLRYADGQLEHVPTGHRVPYPSNLRDNACYGAIYSLARLVKRGWPLEMDPFPDTPTT